jgi:type VI secretion system protein ImpL
VAVTMRIVSTSQPTSGTANAPQQQGLLGMTLPSSIADVSAGVTGGTTGNAAGNTAGTTAAAQPGSAAAVAAAANASNAQGAQ